MKSYSVESSDVWDAVWRKDPYSKHQLRQKKAVEKVDYLAKFISIASGSVVVDLGCGGGYLSEEIYNRYGCRVIGIDFSYEAIAKAVEKNSAKKAMSFINCPVTETKLGDSSCDVVICSGIIEHIKDKNLIFQEINRILKVGGKVFISTSNKRSAVYWQRIVKEFFGVWHYGYQYNYSPLEIKNLLEKYRFEVASLTTITSIEDLKFEGAIDKVLSLFLKNWGRYIFLVCEKRGNYVD